MDMAVDEARHGNEATPVDLGSARIGLSRADDAIAGDGDVAGRDLARREVENADRLDDQVRRDLAARLVDDVGEAGFGQRLSHEEEIEPCVDDGNAASSSKARHHYSYPHSPSAGPRRRPADRFHE